MATSQGGSFLYPITGIKTGYDPVAKKWPARKEIDELMKDPKQALLFITAYNIMQSRPMDHTLSYFQIAGIHGQPSRPWPRQGGPGRGSYCEHSNPNGRFVTWHRVYVLLIEQAMHDIIMELVDPKTPPEKTPIPASQRPDWRTAAETWRLPYWDFALRRENNNNSACLPQIALTETNPLGDNAGSSDPTLPLPSTPFSAENPLFAFRYPLQPGDKLSNHGITDMFDRRGVRVLPLTIAQRTVRHAVAWRDGNAKIQDIWVKGTGDIDSLKTFFRNQTASFRKDLRSCLKSTTTFPEFTMGTVAAGRQASFPDLSSIHGGVHVTTGGWTGDGKNGNMTNVPAAAFDPIFFIFHCSIDRVSAIWEAGHPDPKDPRNWLPAAEDASPLLPFQDATGKKYWISKDTRNLKNLGYTYDVLDEIYNAASMAAVVDELYSDTPFFSAIPSGGASRGFVPAPGRDAPAPEPSDYIFTASYKIAEIGPFGLKIFLEIGGTDYEIGYIINFVNPPDAGCESCEQHQRDETVTRSSTYISTALKQLFQDGILPVEYFVPQEVEPLLQEKLRWRIFALEDASMEIPLESLPSLKVAVGRRDKEPQTSDDTPAVPGRARGGIGHQPTFQSPSKVVAHVPLPGITAGKPGGLGEGEEF